MQYNFACCTFVPKFREQLQCNQVWYCMQHAFDSFGIGTHHSLIFLEHAVSRLFRVCKNTAAPRKRLSLCSAGRLSLERYLSDDRPRWLSQKGNREWLTRTWRRESMNGSTPLAKTANWEADFDTHWFFPQFIMAFHINSYPTKNCLSKLQIYYSLRT